MSWVLLMYGEKGDGLTPHMFSHQGTFRCKSVLSPPGLRLYLLQTLVISTMLFSKGKKKE